MKRFACIVLFFIPLFVPIEIFAQRIFSNIGVATNDGVGYLAAFSLAGDTTFFPKLTLGVFRHGGDKPTFAMFALGARTASAGFFLEGTAGFGFISKTTARLGTNFQFSLAASAGLSFKRIVLQSSFTHFSNAKQVFGFRGLNGGENFIGLGIGWKI